MGERWVNGRTDVVRSLNSAWYSLYQLIHVIPTTEKYKPTQKRWTLHMFVITFYWFMYFYRLQRKFVKVMFSQVSVCPWRACLACTPPRHAPQACPPGMHDARHTQPPQQCTTPIGRYYEMRLMSGRYVSYWNVFLFPVHLGKCNVRHCWKTLWSWHSSNRIKISLDIWYSFEKTLWKDFEKYVNVLNWCSRCETNYSRKDCLQRYAKAPGNSYN